MTSETPRVGLVSLGCPKAPVDSERILTQLRVEGYEVAPTYDAAVHESLDAIGEALTRNGCTMSIPIRTWTRSFR